jgi:hypothetical protein
LYVETYERRKHEEEDQFLVDSLQVGVSPFHLFSFLLDAVKKHPGTEKRRKGPPVVLQQGEVVNCLLCYDY